MAVYLVTYDLNKEVHRPNIVGEIKKRFAWAKLSESSYAIDTTLTPKAVLDILRPLIDGNDDIYIISLTQPWIGFGLKEVTEWLSGRLK